MGIPYHMIKAACDLVLNPCGSLVMSMLLLKLSLLGLGLSMRGVNKFNGLPISTKHFAHKQLEGCHGAVHPPKDRSGNFRWQLPLFAKFLRSYAFGASTRSSCPVKSFELKTLNNILERCSQANSRLVRKLHAGNVQSQSRY